MWRTSPPPSAWVSGAGGWRVCVRAWGGGEGELELSCKQRVHLVACLKPFTGMPCPLPRLNHPLPSHQPTRADRELMLIKLRAPAGPARTEVLQLGEIFRARVVDVSDRCLTLCLSGDPGKVGGGRQSGLRECVGGGFNLRLCPPLLCPHSTPAPTLNADGGHAEGDE